MATEFYDKYEDKPEVEDLDGLEDRIEEERQEQLRIIESLGKEIAKKRDAAVKGRAATGIEKTWEEDEEYYQGIDDANRDSSNWIKAPGVTGGLRRSKPEQSSRCTAFFNITAQFVDSAASRMSDILLPSGDWNFVINPTPVPDTVQPKIPLPSPIPAAGQPDPFAQAMPQAGPMPEVPGPGGMQPTGQMPGVLQPAPKPESADEVVDRSENRIKDWLTECYYHAEVRKVIEDAARIGTGVLKGPVPKRTRKTIVRKGGMGVEIAREENLIPSSLRVSPWNCFPDPSCGESIHEGDYFFERDMITARQLRELKKLPGYLPEQIDSVLDEGPGKKCYSDGMRTGESVTDDDRYEIWYGYCQVDMETLGAVGVDGLPEDSDSHQTMPAVVTIVNDTAIKAFLNPLEDGAFPYDFFPWQTVPNSPFGVGIARKGRVPQEMLNAAARALMDNAAVSSGPIIIVRRNAIRPVDGDDWTLRARKVFIASEQAEIRTVQDAIMSINIPSMQGELQAIIDLAYKMMEESTGIMFLLQGQQGAAPDTVGGMELLNRNASSTLRRLARTFDERITEPHIRRYYDWLLEYGEDNEKGDLVIQAVGSSALVERELQAIELQQLLAASVNPAFGLDPEKTMTELLKIKRMSPDKFLLDEDKKQAMAQQPQVQPVIEAAKIRAEAQVQTAQMREQAAVEKMRIDTDRDAAYNDSLARRDESRLSLEIEALKLKERLAILDYANKREINIEDVKARLAEKAMALRVQKELAGVNATGPQVATPPTEPPGRADNGQAFQE